MTAPFILLINPWIHDFAAYDLWIRPVGLFAVASRLRKKGCGVHFIDCLDWQHEGMRHTDDVKQPRQRQYGQGQFYKQELPKPAPLRSVPRKYSRYGRHPDMLRTELQSIPRPGAVLVGSMMTYWYPGVRECIDMVKTVMPGVPVLLGGVYATLCPGHAAHFSGADHIIAGPCTTAALHQIEQAAGISLPQAEADLFPAAASDLLRPKKVIPLLTSLGCPLRCPYCASGLLWPDFIQRSPHEIAAEIEHWHTRAGTLDFAFYDDALLINPATHIVPLLEMVLDRGLQVRFHAPNGLHVRAIDDRLADLMMRAGFTTLRLGLETADPDLQRVAGNKATRADFVRAAQALKKAGYTAREVGVYILAGLPHQTAHSVHDSIGFVKEHGLRPLLTEYSPIPGTQWWPDAVACSPFPIAEEPLFHNNTLLPCRSEKFTVADLEKLKRESRQL